LDRYNIEEETGSRANLLSDIQKFSNKVDSTTYNKITNSILEEKSSSRSSMRYDSFPSEEFLKDGTSLAEKNRLKDYSILV